MDACLDAIEEAYHSRKLQGQSTIANSSVKEQPIHRIDTGIVKDYVKAVYQDYCIRDRFGPLSNLTYDRPPQLAKLRDSPQVFRDVIGAEVREERRNHSASCVNPSRSSRKYIHITQESKLSRG